MNWMLWLLTALLASGALFTLIVAWIVYSTLLLRLSKQKWAREPSMPEDEEYNKLYDQALNWRKRHLSEKKDVSLENDGFRLYGEYFDFGFDRAVIIIPGRMEACYYSCHYAEPYREAGWNVLTIDDRAHGLSQGRINSLGYREYRDILAWARLLHGEHKNRAVFLHGVCIGSSAALFALVSAGCPDYLCGMAADGMYRRFYDTFLNHMIEQHRPRFPMLWEVMLLIRLVSRADVVRDGPFRRISGLHKPILFLHSREDQYSNPENAQALYDACPSKTKRLVWFEHGGHSRIRVTDPAAYDTALKSFLSDTYGG